MPPLLLRLLLIMGSLMTSSDAGGFFSKNVTLTLENDCASIKNQQDTACEDPKVYETTNGKYLYCNQDSLVLVQGELLTKEISAYSKPSLLLASNPHFKVSCVSKCHKTFVKDKCPPGVQACREVFKSIYEVSCPNPTTTLVMAGIPTKSPFLTCDPSKGWMDGTNTIVNFATQTDPNVEAYCHENCDQTHVECSNCLLDALTTVHQVPTLKCPSGSRIMFEGTIYESLTCSREGWKGFEAATQTDPATILNLTENPFAKIKVKCQLPCDQSMVIDTCTPGECKAEPKFEAGKLTCSSVDHYLLIDGKGKNVHTDVTCSDNGWKSTEMLTGKFEKIRAKCYSKCHSEFIDMNCTAPCNKPFYLYGQFVEKNVLFCRSASDVLVFDGKEVSDLVCDPTKGWTDLSGALIVDFTSPLTSTTSTAMCRIAKKKAQAKEIIAGMSNAVFIVIVGTGVLLVGIFITLLSLFLLYILRNKKRNSSESSKETKKKTKSSKKSKKSSKRKSKKDKKTEKETAVQLETIISPGHQMSALTSGTPLTAGLVAASPVAASPPAQSPVAAKKSMAGVTPAQSPVAAKKSMAGAPPAQSPVGAKKKSMAGVTPAQSPVAAKI